MNRFRRIVLLAAVVLFLAWLIANFGRIISDSNGFIRFVLGTLFGILILARWKPVGEGGFLPRWFMPVAGITGAVLAILGIVLEVHQFEWLGVVLLLYACLRWALPERFGKDLFLALFLIYWIHPLPGQIFGKMQLVMQWLSVNGAEWLLQAANVRVWADGFILHTGLRVFGVPEACSGMRTAVTVFLCTLGVGMLFSFRWYEIVVFLFLGLVQVLVMNILRIAFMVTWAPRMPPAWSESFLHDTLGIFLLITILIVQAEASWWKVRKTRRRRREDGVASGELEPEDRASRLPRFWRRVNKWGVATMLVMLVVAGAFFAAYKRRPAHRAAMIEDILDGLEETDLATAERAVNAALSYAPGKRSLQSAKLRILVMRGKYAEVLKEMEQLPRALSNTEKLWKSRALVAEDRLDEAIALIDSLPASARDRPLVAIARAEYAALADDPETVSRYIAKARGDRRLVPRIRALFPYLASHEQWSALVAADNSGLPYEMPRTALLAVHARLRTRDIAGTAAILEEVMRKWPNDPRFLEALLQLALVRPGGGWEEHFAANLQSNVMTLSSENLSRFLSSSFRISRPDLVWLLHARLKDLDPDHPMLLLAPARYGHLWFTFRRRFVGVESRSAMDTINLRPLYQETKSLEPFRSFWNRVPLADQLGTGEIDAVRSRFLRAALAEFERRKKTEALSPEFKMDYAGALSMAGRHGEAHAVLDDIISNYPDLRAPALLQHAVLFNRQLKWQRAYEALRKYEEAVPYPDIRAKLLTINAFMNMNLGVAAMEVARRSQETFPGSSQMRVAVASIWDVFGFKEEALFVLTRGESVPRSQSVIQLMYDTGRYLEATKLSRALGIPIEQKEMKERQSLVPMPAELVFARRWPQPLSDEAMEETAKSMKEQLPMAVSPFMRRLGELMAEWYSQHGRGDICLPARWESIGRDDLEKGAALHRLVSLLARQERYDEALAAARRGVEILPHSVVFWRTLVGLSGGDADLTREARAACPDDPEIWLASLVVRTREEGKGDWAVEEVDAATQGDRFSVGAIVRAGDFLLRNGMSEAAVKTARYAARHAQGYLPAYVLGLRCALGKRNEKWALLSALEGADYAVNPGPFYKTIVNLKWAGESTDADMIHALEYLQENFPEESEWAERLGYVYFQKQDTKRALNVLSSLIEDDATGVRVQSLLLAAESARVEGNFDKAISILEEAHKIYPERADVLNNLVYTLAQNSDTLPRARSLLPELVKKGGESFAVLDTLAVVHLKAGEPAQALMYTEKALELLSEDDYAASEVRLNAAQILFRLGKYEEAREKIERIRRDPSRSPLVDLGAQELLRRIELSSGAAR